MRCKYTKLFSEICSALQISSVFRHFLQCAAFFAFFTKNFRNEEFHNRNIVYNWIRTSAPAYVEQSFQLIYHPSRFIVEIHINLLIYRYFNSVMDTPKTGISITLSLTIWLHPSRFSHHQVSHAVIKTLAMNGWHLRKLATEADKIAQLHR